MLPFYIHHGDNCYLCNQDKQFLLLNGKATINHIKLLYQQYHVKQQQNVLFTALDILNIDRQISVCKFTLTRNLLNFNGTFQKKQQNSGNVILLIDTHWLRHHLQGHWGCTMHFVRTEIEFTNRSIVGRT